MGASAPVGSVIVISVSSGRRLGAAALSLRGVPSLRIGGTADPQKPVLRRGAGLMGVFGQGQLLSGVHPVAGHSAQRFTDRARKQTGAGVKRADAGTGPGVACPAEGGIAWCRVA